MSSFVRAMLKEQAAGSRLVPDRNRTATKQSKSYCDARVIVGEAICRKIRSKEIEYTAARRLIYDNLKSAKGNVFTRIVNQECFEDYGYGLLCKFAEVLSIDPNVEIAKYIVAKRPEIVEIIVKPELEAVR